MGRVVPSVLRDISLQPNPRVTPISVIPRLEKSGALNVHVVTDKDSTGARRRREGEGTRGDVEQQKYSEVSGCVRRRDKGGSKEVKSY